MSLLVEALTSVIQSIGADIKALTSGKVSTVEGKSLSTNDYTTVEKNKLASTVAAGYDNLVVNSAGTGTVVINLALATVFDITLTGNTTFSFTNVPVPTGQSFSWVVRVTQGATARTITWPTITWLTSTGAKPDDPLANKLREYVFSTQNGTLIYGRGGAAT